MFSAVSTQIGGAVGGQMVPGSDDVFPKLIDMTETPLAEFVTHLNHDLPQGHHDCRWATPCSKVLNLFSLLGVGR